MSSRLGERLREAAALGDLEEVQALLQKGVDVNSQNEINGWTCLHWACKQNHTQMVVYLLASGADKEILTNEGDLAAYLTSELEIKRMLGVEDDHHEENDLNQPVVANCMANPTFSDQEREKVPDSSAPPDTSTAVSDLSEGESSPCLSPTQDDKDCKPSSTHNETELARQGRGEAERGFPTGMETSKCTKHSSHSCPVYTPSVFHNSTLFTSTQHLPQQANGSCMDTALPWQPLLLTGTFPPNMQELVLKVRVQNPKENDFIEIELNRQELTYPDLLRVSCCELDINPEQVQKIRKLPNTLVRKDKDVARLQDFQELELVLGESINPSFRSAAATLTERPCYNATAVYLTY